MNDFNEMIMQSISDGRPVSSVTNLIPKMEWRSFVVFPNGAMWMQLFSTELDAIEGVEKSIKNWQNRQA